MAKPVKKKIVKKSRNPKVEVLTPHKVLNDKQKQEVAHVVAEMYAGPLPRAEQFAAYEKVHKGAAGKIIGMAEKALSAEVFSMKADKITEFVSMLLSRLFLYALLAAAIWLVFVDKPVAAALAGLAPIISIIYSTFKKPDEQEKKSGKKEVPKTN